jgi:hypothetical protein
MATEPRPALYGLLIFLNIEVTLMATRGTKYVQKPYIGQASIAQNKRYQQNVPRYQAAYQEMQAQGMTTPDATIKGQFPKLQVWRAGKASTGGPMGAGMNLGNMGPLPPLNIVTINLDPITFNQLSEASQYMFRRKLSESEILRDLKADYYQPLAFFIEGFINILVPKASGQLRNMLRLSVYGGATGGGNSSTSQLNSLHPFYVVISTGNIQYASVVNNMPTPWLQHPGVHDPNERARKLGRGQKVKQILNDPNAEEGWYEKIYEKGVAEAERLWNRWKFFYLYPLISPLAGRMNVGTDQLIDALFEVTFG